MGFGNKALAKKVAESATPMELLRIAVTDSADVDKLERLMALQERWESNQARKAFYAALNKVQSDLTPVTRDARNEQTRSMYARLETVHKAIAPIIATNGFSISHDEIDSPQEGQTRFRMRVRHVDGHTEDVHIDLPLDDKGIKGNPNKTAVHAKASSASYAQRLLESRFFAVVFAGVDDDANTAGSKSITGEQAATIRDLLNSLDKSETVRTLKYCGVENVADIPMNKYSTIVTTLNTKIKTRAD